MNRNNNYVSNSEIDLFGLIESASNVLQRNRYKDKKVLHRVKLSIKYFTQCQVLN